MLEISCRAEEPPELIYPKLGFIEYGRLPKGIKECRHMDLTDYIGPAAFGSAYRYMLENDAHAPGSVDRQLIADMVRLCAETAEYLYTAFTPLEVRYVPGSRPVLDSILNSLPQPIIPAGIAAFTCRIADKVPAESDELILGGTEEEIINRGSDWCMDIARVACVLMQMAGYPARIVSLFNLNQAYSGHVIVEAYYNGKWGAIDSTTGIVYRHPDGQPAAVWELMRNPALIEVHAQNPGAFYTTVEQFQAAGMVNYFCWDMDKYDYTVATANCYYRTILDMAKKGWPGGLRWLHGEDRLGS
jgi:hypothetical protein